MKSHSQDETRMAFCVRERGKSGGAVSCFVFAAFGIRAVAR